MLLFDFLIALTRRVGASASETFKVCVRKSAHRRPEELSGTVLPSAALREGGCGAEGFTKVGRAVSASGIQAGTDRGYIGCFLTPADDRGRAHSGDPA